MHKTPLLSRCSSEDVCLSDMKLWHVHGHCSLISTEQTYRKYPSPHPHSKAMLWVVKCLWVAILPKDTFSLLSCAFNLPGSSMIAGGYGWVREDFLPEAL